MWKRALLCVLYLSFASSPLLAEEESGQGTEKIKNDYQYFQLEPDIITNYIKPGKRIGFVRITVELMVKSKSNYAVINEHEPLIRDKIISILGQQTEAIVKSVTERDGIRQRCLDEVNELLYVETGKKPLEDLLFTKYLYQ
ncbi:flagellar basal body-associated protein FliL [Psychromonas marina]|uniref:Flagellar protein FliL n=1 Tax=Psychromonas marina TaxID=88364 RepID=A0ABQ6DXA5_9GAMM|nr:flagellar basal body-associated protein FliL [Psychromonas marina]GLS89630.1 flagellar basal body-associated protein FliL [Psychromonas marina]